MVSFKFARVWLRCCCLGPPEAVTRGFEKEYAVVAPPPSESIERRRMGVTVETRATEIARGINQRFDARMAFKFLARSTGANYEELVEDFSLMVAVRIEHEVQQDLEGFEKRMNCTEMYTAEDIMEIRREFSEKYNLATKTEEMMWGKIEAEAKKQALK